MSHQLDDLEKQLIAEAIQRLKHSYAPYSNIHVVSAVVIDKDRVFWGVNVENSSYGLTICAERVAISAAIANGFREFSKIIIVSDFEEPLLPCGACLQFMAEFVDDVEIVSYSAKSGKVIRTSLSELLPKAFRLKN